MKAQSRELKELLDQDQHSDEDDDAVEDQLAAHDHRVEAEEVAAAENDKEAFLAANASALDVTVEKLRDLDLRKSQAQPGVCMLRTRNV